MSLDWRTAYLEQAKSDYETLQKLLADDAVPLCQCLHYLQMTTEKLSKGLLTQAGGSRYPKTRDALVRFMRLAKGRPEIRRACGFSQKPSSMFAAYVDGLLPLAQAVEGLSPEGGDHPNPEYPWEQGGLIASPLSHPFADFDLKQQSRKMVQFLELVEACFRIA